MLVTFSQDKHTHVTSPQVKKPHFYQPRIFSHAHCRDDFSWITITTSYHPTSDSIFASFKLYINGIIEHILFCVWSFQLSIALVKFIPVISCYNFLILITMQYFIVGIHNNSFPHCTLDECLGNFLFWGLKNNAATVSYMLLGRAVYTFLFGIYLRSGLLSHKLCISGCTNKVFRIDCHNIHYPGGWGFTSLPSLGIVYHFHFSHCGRRQEILHCGFRSASLLNLCKMALTTADTTPI